MPIPGLIVLIAQASAPALSTPPHQASVARPMACETGRVTKTLGGTEWIVVSCADQASMVVVTAKGNPAAPFYFFLKPDSGGGYTIAGEGNGSKEASDAPGTRCRE